MNAINERYFTEKQLILLTKLKNIKMKKLLILSSMLLTIGFVKAQDFSVSADYQEVGTEKWYKAVVYYKKDKNGLIVLTRYSISGIQNGRGDFNPNSYPFNCVDCPTDKGVKYQYKMVAGCCGQVYFKVD